MNCKNCGAEFDENTCFCPNCGEYCNVSEDAPKTIHRAGTEIPERPDATLWIIIGVLSTIFCCVIGGIGTTVYAAKASGNISSGDLALANENIAKAKKWFIATLILGIVSLIIGVLAEL